MQIKNWIIVVICVILQVVVNQSVKCQGVVGDYFLASEIISSESVSISPNFDLKKSNNSISPIIKYHPISKSDKALSKINSSNWNWSKEQNFHFQKLSTPIHSESYIRFDNIDLSEGEWLEIVDITTAVSIDQIDHYNNRYMAGPISTEEMAIIIHSSDPAAINRVRVGEVYIGAMDFGYDSSFECHKNVACDEGQEFNDQKRGVVRIRMVLEEGIGFCTGALVNNTSMDRTPYILSAFHCQDGFTPIFDDWTFDFSYESFSCADPDSEPDFVRATGCEMVAGFVDTDMLLLRMTGAIPDEANAYFSGWNRDMNYEPEGGVLIHHPRGDIKKISVENDPIVPFNATLNWDNGITTPVGSHLVTRFDESTYEGGSSGGPLYDYDGYIVGQLHGGPDGDDMCTIGIGYHGRISESWEGGGTPDTRLKDWLDPDGTDSLSIQGLEFSASGTSFIRFEGRLVTPDGIAIPDVRVTIKGDKEESFMTGSDGRFVFDNLPKTGSYQMEFAKDTNHGNGVSAIDLVQIQNHILGTVPLFGTFQQRSADANNDGRVSSSDLVQILNVIIGRAERFPTNTSWKFEPQFIEVTPENTQSLDRQIIGYKIGDVNFSANPRR